MDSTKPKWWDASDDETVTRYRQWETTDWYPDNPGLDALEWCESEEFKRGHFLLGAFLDLHADKWTCRRCQNWISDNGCVGGCNTLRQETKASSMCEDFYPLAIG